MSKITLIFLFLIITLSLFGQNDNYYSHRFLVEKEVGFNLQKWAKSHSDEIRLIRPIFKKLNYWLIEFEKGKTTNAQARKSILTKTKGIKSVYQDFEVRARKVPNDPMFTDQWSKSLIEVEKVWDITTGGTTVDGQEIVVAVIDDGFEIIHVDLQKNIWTNKGEIESNSIDDDENGYVDDFNGLHLPTQTDNHIVDNHGISVSGILGGIGNNDKGIAGINWDIKMMLMSIKRSSTSSGGSVLDVIQAYGYALDQRKRYNDTNGKEGAFVVVTNYSGGVDEKFPNDFPTWCPIYEELGKVGIINITAVSNKDNNVEAIGDMPSVCDSDFIITVTNTDIADKKVMQAAYGNISVDLSAPGEGALSTISQSRYREFNGTSSSAPQVAGVAALLYSVPCINLIDLAKADPPAAALEIKRVIMESVDPLLDLEGITVTGGRLNAFKAYRELDKIAPVIENCPENVTLREDEPTYQWDELLISDDCGSIIIQSNIDNGSEFRIGTTGVNITAIDLLGNRAECKFNVTREGKTDQEASFVEVGKVLFSKPDNVLKIQFETGSFEIHIIDIYNMLGQRIRQQQFVPTNSSINTATIKNIDFAQGTYFIVLSKAGGAIRNAHSFVVAF
ncbi:MAG: S8 family serine peptidase [Saprospiraceae bacterium]